MLENLVTQDKEGGAERRSKEHGEVQSEFVGIFNAERQVLKMIIRKLSFVLIFEFHIRRKF